MSGRGVRAAIGLGAAGLCLLAPGIAPGLSLKLWPLIDYREDGRGGRELKLLGPLFAYASDADGSRVTLRPLLNFTRKHARRRHEMSFLYPLAVWQRDTLGTDFRVLGGLIRFSTRGAAESRPEQRRFTLFPFVFYRSNEAEGTSLSVLPFYADVSNFLGYDRIRMLAFPFYLELREGLVEQRWLPFPFFSWSGGRLGQGYRFWPFYGWTEKGYAERSRYVLWPFYVSHELHYTRPERERRLILYPFYASAQSPTLDSRSYFLPFFLPFLTHSVDLAGETETWGFPWPFWLLQHDLATGERRALRLTPFYQDTHFGGVHARFVLWPAYRWQRQEVDDYVHTRRDAFMVLYRDIHEEQPRFQRTRRLQTLFPLYRGLGSDGHSSFSTPALLDALFPRNREVLEVYAPLWQVYHHESTGAGPTRWSLLWDLVSSDGTRVRYPVSIEGSH